MEQSHTQLNQRYIEAKQESAEKLATVELLKERISAQEKQMEAFKSSLATLNEALKAPYQALMDLSK